MDIPEEELREPDDVGADEPTVEDQVRSTVKMINIASSRLLMQKAKDAERVLSQNREPYNLSMLSAVMDEYDKALSKAIVRKQAWQHCTESTALLNILSQAPEDENTEDAATYKKVKEMLKERFDLHENVKELFEKQREVKEQIINKKEELQQKLQEYKHLLMTQEQELEKKATEAEEQNTKREEQLTKKLEKLNVMRAFMVNIIAFSDVDYMHHPELVNILYKNQSPITADFLANPDDADDTS